MGAGADDPIFDINRVSESIDATNAQELSKAFGGAKIPFLDADAGEVVYGIMSSGAVPPELVKRLRSTPG